MKTFNTVMTIVIFSLSGCAADEAEIQAEFDSYVAARQSCEVDSDCGLVYPGCPLGCYVVVATDHAGVNKISNKPRIELIETALGSDTVDDHVGVNVLIFTTFEKSAFWEARAVFRFMGALDPFLNLVWASTLPLPGGKTRSTV